MGDSRVFLRVRVGTNGALDIAPAVASVNVQDEDRGTDTATIVMDDHAGISTDVIHAGDPIRIEMGWEGEHAVLFLGRVHRLESYTRSGAIGRLRFTCHDMSELLNVRPVNDTRDHTGSLDRILRDLATEAGLTFGGAFIDPMPQFPDHGIPLLQRSRTNWAMIQEIARDYNSRAFVEVNSLPGNRDPATEAASVAQLYFYSEQAMVAQEPLGKLTLCHGFGSLINFQMTQIGSGAMPSSEATMVDPVSGEVRTETAPAGAAAPAISAIPGGALDQLRNVHGDAAARSAEAGMEVTSSSVTPRSDAAVPVRSAGVPSDGARARRLISADPTRYLGQSVNGTAMGTVFLRAKASVEVEGHSASSNGIWYLRRVNHIIEQARSTPTDPAAPLSVKTYRTTFEATR